MHTIATLGPAGTFSDQATRRYLATLAESAQVAYHGSLKSALRSIGAGCARGVLPFENLSEGFVSVVVDHLVEADLQIVGEVLLPIRFAFISHAARIEDVTSVHVQFVARGQCSRFLDGLAGVEVVTTESNMASRAAVSPDTPGVGAVVPARVAMASAAPLCLDDAYAEPHNQTRFVVLAPGKSRLVSDVAPAPGPHRTSLLVLGGDDRPGRLQAILAPLAAAGLNLTSIVSRPTRRRFGRYHFLLELDGHLADPRVRDALDEVRRHGDLKVLGSYPRAEGDPRRD